MEKVNRLQTTRDALRELYLKSGNRCAFPGCEKTILNDKGNVVGQICHIEAAKPGGQRFNSSQTNEERRQASNLLLLCYEHHIETNDEKEYTVERLKKMKEDHEKKYGDIENKLFNSISDKTKNQTYSYCRSLKRFEKTLEWSLDEEERLQCVNQLKEEVNKLRNLSPEPRAIFKIMLEKSEKEWIYLDEIPMITRLSRNDVKGYVQLLWRKGLITEPEVNDDIATSSFVCELWPNIKQFAERSSITLEEIIDNMDFSLLD
ncbi:hypothetical protein [Bacillus cereus group sp. MYBK95-2]|uniref:hypothetical protein n=1 Tax=Bacillus cereus group sp. MYBK95-2 TaxID=3450599 RepID=UPI003F7B180F